jgi:UDP-glucose 4-epimerase
MNIIVTGGLGFVGSNLVDRLLEDDHRVWVFDNLSSESSTEDYQSENTNASYFIEDIKYIGGYSEYFKEVGIDRIFHLAGSARIQPSFENPVEYFENNAQNTVRMLEFAKEISCKSLVYATTSSKNHDKGHLLTPYTFSKVVGEDACRMFADIYDMNIGIATFYNVYGPREPREGEWATVVAKFLRQYENEEPITIVGDGLQTRDFTHVDDICDGLIKISEGKWKGHNFDLGRGNPISILELANWICEGEEDRIQHVPLRKNEGLHTEAEWKKTESLLRWRAKKDLKDYITSKIKQL